MTDTQNLSMGRRRKGFSQGFPKQSFQMPGRKTGWVLLELVLEREHPIEIKPGLI